MKPLIVTFLLFLGLWIKPHDPIKGTYKIEYDQKILHDNILTSITFADSTYERTFKSGKKGFGKIIRWYDDNKNQHWVRLIDNDSNEPQGGLDSLIKTSFGTPVIEFLETANDTVKFRTTYTSNLHLTINEGKLIRDLR